MKKSDLAQLRLPLTPRQLQVAMLYCEGFTTLQLSSALCIAESTVKGAIAEAKAKFSNADRVTKSKLSLRARLSEDGLLLN